MPQPVGRARPANDSQARTDGARHATPPVVKKVQKAVPVGTAIQGPPFGGVAPNHAGGATIGEPSRSHFSD